MDQRDTSTSSSDVRTRAIALVAALLLHVAVFAVLMMMYLRYSPAEIADREWPPVDSAEILFGGEYVMVGDTPDPVADSQAAGESAPAPEDDAAADVEPAAAVISTTQPSPAKANPDTRSAEQARADEAARIAAEQQRKRDEIDSRVRFNNNSSTTAQDNASATGSPDGNSSTGAVSGTPGVNMGGRTLASWQKPVSGPMGSITIRVTVDRQGRVTSAAYASGTGPAASSTASRQSCIAAATASRFSVDTTAPASQTGTITYHFK